MKSVWKRTTALTLSASLVGACATSPEKIQTAYVSPLAYQNYSCKDIRAELGRVTLRAQELQASLKEKADNDTGKMVIGMVFFWPILFALEGDDPSAQEYARLKGERDTLEQLATQKNCGNITIVDVKPEEPGKQASVQPAGSMPVQPSEPTQTATPAPQPAASSVAMAAPAAASAPATAAEPATTGPGGLRQGDRWDYVVVDSRKGGRVQRSFEIEQTSDVTIVERIRLEDGKTLSAEHRKGAYLSMSGGMQFAPYYLALQPVTAQGRLRSVKVVGGDACATREEGGGDYASAHECQIEAVIAGSDRVTVPAGTFDTIRVHVAIDSEAVRGLRIRQHIGDGDFWISPKAGRLVKATVKYDASRPWTETMELESTSVALTQ